MFSRRSYIRSPNRTKKKRIILYGRIVGVLVLLVIILSGVVYFLGIKALTISDIEVLGNSVISRDEIVAATEPLLAGKRIFFFPRSNIFLYPKSAIREELATKFPRISTVKVGFKNFHSISIKVAEYIPKAIWCGEDSILSTKTKEDCYLMDKNGYIFASSPNFSAKVYFSYYGPLSSTSDTPVGLHYLASEKFKSVDAFIKALEELGIVPMRIIAEDAGNFTVDLGGGAEILFNGDGNLENTLQNFYSIINSGKLPITDSAFIATVDYIDLRFGNKIYYKLHNGGGQPTPKAPVVPTGD